MILYVYGIRHFLFYACLFNGITSPIPAQHSRVTLYTAGHLHTAVPHCSHSRAPIVHTAVPRENNEHGCVYLICTAVCKLPGCVEGHPWHWALFHRVPSLWNLSFYITVVHLICALFEWHFLSFVVLLVLLRKNDYHFTREKHIHMKFVDKVGQPMCDIDLNPGCYQLQWIT